MRYKSQLISAVCTCIVFVSLSTKAATVVPSDYLNAGDIGDTWTYEGILDGSQTTWTLSNVTSGNNAGRLRLGDSVDWIIYDVVSSVFTIYETNDGIVSPPFAYPATAQTEQMYIVSGEEFLFITSPNITVQAGTFSNILGLVGLDSAAGPNDYNTLLGLDESQITAAVSSVSWYAAGIGLVEGIGVSFSTGEVDGGIELISTTVVPVPAAAWLFGTALIGFIGFSRRRKIG